MIKTTTIRKTTNETSKESVERRNVDRFDENEQANAETPINP